MANFKYLQLADQLKGDIESSRLSAGQQIPTEDELMERFALSRNTVRQAVKCLVEEGYLLKIQGSGTFVTGGKKPSAKSGGGVPRGRKCIGVVMNRMENYIFPRILMGIGDCLVEHGYYMLLRVSFNHIDNEAKALTELLDGDLAGLIVEPARSGFPSANRELYRRIEREIPCVLMHAEMPGFNFPSVMVDDQKGFELLTRHLVEKGHENIAALCKLDEQTGVKRFLGFAAGLRACGLTMDESRVVWFADEESETLFSGPNVERVMKVIDDCTAVMCFNDDLATRFYSFMRSRGASIPEDISVTGFDDSVMGKAPPLTTIVHPQEILGRTIAEAAVALAEGATGDVSVVYPPQLLDRGTVLERVRTADGVVNV